MLGLGTLAKKVGGLAKKGASNVAHGKGLMGDKTSALSKFRDWRDKKKGENAEQGGPPTNQIIGGPVKPATPPPQLGQALPAAMGQMQSPRPDLGALGRPNPYNNPLQGGGGGLF